MNARGAAGDARVAAYKALLRLYLDRRPSGTRQKIASALGKHKSFVSQIANPAYPMPVPARHLHTIFELCHFSVDERRNFLDAYVAAHPRREFALQPAGHANRQRIEIDVPLLADPRAHAALIDTIRQLAASAIALAQISSIATTDSQGPPPEDAP